MNISHLTIVAADRTVIIDGHCEQMDLDIAEDIHAVQWHNGQGEIEYKDERLNESFTSLEPYISLIEAHALLVYKTLNPPAPTEEEKYAELISKRDHGLSSTDWIIKRHRDQKDLGKETSLSEDEFFKVLQWQDELRHLPQLHKTSDEWVWPVTPDSVKASFDTQH